MSHSFGAYLIALTIDPVRIGESYTELPLHCTLVQKFSLAPHHELAMLREVGHVMRLCAMPALRAKAPALFGLGADVPVHTLEITTELKVLHVQAIAALAQFDVEFENPEWKGDGYHPHVTPRKNGATLPLGAVHFSSECYVVRFDSLRVRTVIHSFPFIQSE